MGQVFISEDEVYKKDGCDSKVTPEHFDELCLKDIIKMETVPPQLILNWDLTGVNPVPASAWTMER